MYGNSGSRRSFYVGGICDRTPEVRDALLDAMSFVTDCRDVTEDHLEAVYGPLDLSYPSERVASQLTTLKEWDWLEGLGNRLSVWLSSFDDHLTNLRDVSSNLLRDEFDVTGLVREFKCLKESFHLPD